MDLELATVGDLVDELRKRELCFSFVSVESTNRCQSNLVYAYQGKSYTDLLWLIRGLRRHLIDSSGRNEICDTEP